MEKTQGLIACIIIALFFMNMNIVAEICNADSLTKKPYDDLIQNDLTYFASRYTNESLPGFSIYINAKNNSPSYPLYAYNLIQTCYRKLLTFNLTERIRQSDEQSATEMYLNDIQDKFSTVNKSINTIVPQTLASLEWFGLAKRELSDVNQWIDRSAEYYIQKDYNTSLLLLSSSDFALKKAADFALLATERNTADALFLNISQLVTTAKLVALQWINHVESTITFYKNLGYEKQLTYSQDAINQSRNDYEKNLYYVAIMNAAYAQALANYFVHADMFFTNYSETLIACKAQITYFNLVMDQIYKSPDIDTPIAESNIEFARIHLTNAENENNQTIAISYAQLSLQESLIAYEQARAVLDLKNAVMKGTGTNPEDNTQGRELTNNYIIDYILVGLIVMETIVLLVIIFKKK